MIRRSSAHAPTLLATLILLLSPASADPTPISPHALPHGGITDSVVSFTGSDMVTGPFNLAATFTMYETEADTFAVSPSGVRQWDRNQLYKSCLSPLQCVYWTAAWVCTSYGVSGPSRRTDTPMAPATVVAPGQHSLLEVRPSCCNKTARYALTKCHRTEW